MLEDDKKAFPEILAVDPEGCGCTECLVGEYVNEKEYLARATAGDLISIANGEVQLNTYNESTLDFFLNNSFNTLSAQNFVTRLKDKLEELLQEMDASELL